jgi:hypothetical protein
MRARSTARAAAAFTHLDAKPQVHTVPLAHSTAQWLLPQRTEASSDAPSGNITGVGAAALS